MSRRSSGGPAESCGRRRRADSGSYPSARSAWRCTDRASSRSGPTSALPPRSARRARRRTSGPPVACTEITADLRYGCHQPARLHHQLLLRVLALLDRLQPDEHVAASCCRRHRPSARRCPARRHAGQVLPTCRARCDRRATASPRCSTRRAAAAMIWKRDSSSTGVKLTPDAG